MVVDLSEPDQSRQGAGCLDGQRAHRPVGGPDRVGRTAGDRYRQFGGFGYTVHDPGAQRHTGIGRIGRGIRHRLDIDRFGVAAGDPQHPVGDSGPGDGGRLRSDDQTEVAGPEHHLVDVGLGRGPFDTAYRRRLTDVVDLADECQHRAGDIAEGDQLTLDGEAAGHHPVVRDELFEQLRDGRTGPGDPALPVEESALLLTW